MKRILIASILVFLMYQTAFSQEKRDGGQGYVFFASGIEPRNHYGTAHIGVGGELLFKNVGIGPEIGYLTRSRDWAGGIGVLSPNASYHFTNSKLEPFVTGGYTLFFRDGHANGYNFGGGVNYWFSNKAALRLEARDHVLPGYRDSHFLGFRVGLSFK
jgi:hypothetical protein